MEQDTIFETEALGYMDRVYTLATRLCRNETTAQDLTQETYLKAWRFRDSFQPGTSMRAWLCTILRNSYFNELKKNKHDSERVELESVLPVTAARQTALPGDGLGDEMLSALSSLHPRQRLVVLLADVEEWTYAEIARALSCPVNTVGTLLCRARRSLRTFLENLRREAQVVPARAEIPRTVGRRFSYGSSQVDR